MFSASSLGVPALVMRETTERPEALQSKIITLVGYDQKTIINKTCNILDNDSSYNRIAVPYQIFGKGIAAKKIIKV